MAAEVMITDVIEIDCFGNSRHLVDITQEAIQIKVIADAVLITLEVGHIHWIKTDQRGPQVNSGLRLLIRCALFMPDAACTPYPAYKIMLNQ